MRITKYLIIAVVMLVMGYPLQSRADSFLSISSPVSGQSFKQGDQLNIIWKVSGLTNPIVDVSIHRYDNGSTSSAFSYQAFSNGHMGPNQTEGSWGTTITNDFLPSSTYKVQISYRDSAVLPSTVWSDFFSITSTSGRAATHSAGTNIKTPDGTIYLIDRNSQRRPYTSAGAFLSYKFNNWANVMTANSNDLALPIGVFIPPRDGSIICSDRGSSKGTCYLITEGWKTGFTSQQQFEQAGFSFKNALYGDVSFMGEKSNITSGTAAHLPGTLVSDGKTIYFVGREMLMGFPSAATLFQWGYDFSDAVPMNATDYTAPRSGIISEYLLGQLSPL